MSVTYNYFLFARLAVLESFSVVQVYEVKVYIFLFTAMSWCSPQCLTCGSHSVFTESEDENEHFYNFFLNKQGEKKYSSTYDIFEGMKDYGKPVHFLIPEAFEENVLKF